MGRIMIRLCSVVDKANLTMRVLEYSLLFCSLFLNTYGLDCRSEGGPKESELKRIYNVCMKQQNKNNSDNDGDYDQDWRETRRYNQRPHDDMAWNKENKYSDHGMEEKGQGEGHKMDSKDRTEDQHMGRQDRRSKNNNRMQHRDRDGDERMYSREGRGERRNSNGDNRSQRNNDVNDRNDFYQSDNFNGYNNYQYSTQPSRRYKRERRIEMNSGKRSQYNPNPQRFSGYEERYKGEDKNSSETNSTTDDDGKTCALHCLLENLHMTDESGMPDRYLVTHTITKNVKDDDLKDFLQESIEECFEILDNENTDDKCEFSKNLLVCLSEKGRANCDDWKDDFQF